VAPCYIDSKKDFTVQGGADHDHQHKNQWFSRDKQQKDTQQTKENSRVPSSGVNAWSRMPWVDGEQGLDDVLGHP
jgi:hypothetical protein